MELKKIGDQRFNYKEKGLNILFYQNLILKDIYTQSIHIRELAENLSKLGHTVLFSDIEYPLDEKGCTWLMSMFNRSKNIAFIVFLRTLIALFRMNTKPDIIYMRHNLYDAGYFLSKIFQIPIIIEVNGIVVDEMKIWTNHDDILLGIIDRIEHLNLPKANKIITVTEKLKEVLHEEYKIPLNKLVVLENGANTDLFKPIDQIEARTILGLDLKRKYICFVGSLSPHQGVEYLIKSAPLILEKNPFTCFLIVGGGNLESTLKNLTKELNIENRFIFTGIVKYDTVNIFISASDLCVAPYIKKRNEKIGISPLKLYEYLACGKPVIASNITGLSDLLEKANAGIVVSPENPQELAKAICELLKNDQLREQFGENGHTYVSQNHSWTIVAKKVVDICENILAGSD